LCFCMVNFLYLEQLMENFHGESWVTMTVVSIA
jgi:hypothetical protein